MTSFIVYPASVGEKAVLAAYDDVIRQLAEKGPDAQELERIRAKMRSDWYGQLEVPVDRAVLISHAVLFDGNPDRVNEVPAELATVTADQVRTFAAKYLVASNRTILNRVPAQQQGTERPEKKGGN
jgi:predicted Zn-dependent peptidase